MSLPWAKNIAASGEPHAKTAPRRLGLAICIAFGVGSGARLAGSVSVQAVIKRSGTRNTDERRIGVSVTGRAWERAWDDPSLSGRPEEQGSAGATSTGQLRPASAPRMGIG
jgi:hypothetical protein